MCYLSRVMYHMSYVIYHMLRITCQLSITPIAKATDSPPATSSSMHSRLVCKDPKTNCENFNLVLGVIFYLTYF